MNVKRKFKLVKLFTNQQDKKRSEDVPLLKQELTNRHRMNRLAMSLKNCVPFLKFNILINSHYKTRDGIFFSSQSYAVTTVNCYQLIYCNKLLSIKNLVKVYENKTYMYVNRFQNSFIQSISNFISYFNYKIKYFLFVQYFK